MASAALMNVYQKIEDGTFEIHSAPEPDDDGIPNACGVYFGSQLGWSREREGIEKISLPFGEDSDTGETLIVEVCPTCLSGFAEKDPLANRVVCAACLRCSQDARIRQLAGTN